MRASQKLVFRNAGTVAKPRVTSPLRRRPFSPRRMRHLADLTKRRRAACNLQAVARTLLARKRVRALRVARAEFLSPDPSAQRPATEEDDTEGQVTAIIHGAE